MSTVNLTSAKYVLVNERLGTIEEVVGTYETDMVASDAYAQADIVRPNWRSEGLKLWLRVGKQG